MLGLTLLFTLGDYRVLAKVTTMPFQEAVKRATTVTKRGADIEAGFTAAKSDWTKKNEEGKALIVDPTDRALWPQFFATISGFFPDPEDEYDLDPSDPKSVDTLEMLRVHIDAIKPVYRKDVAADWFTQLDPKFKMLMHPYDVDNAPSGEGWIIQIIGHHYNPYPRTREQHTYSQKDRRRTDFGPVEFLTDKVLPKLNDPRIRLFGVHHVAVAWMTSEKEWTTEKGQGNNNLASNTIPLLDRALAPAAAADSGGGAGMNSSMMAGMQQMMRGSQSGGMGGAQGGAMMERMRGMMGGSMAGGMGGMFPGGGTQADLKKQMRTLTRTDFLLQFVWQLPKEEERPKTDEERAEKLKKIITDMTDAEKKNPAVKISQEEIQKELDAASRKKSEQLDSQVKIAVGAGTGAGGAVPGVVPPVGNVPVPGAAVPKPGGP